MVNFAQIIAMALTGLLLWSAWSDVTDRRIANLTVAGVAALYPLAVVLDVLPGSPVAGLILAGIVFVIGLAVFAAGAIGGGDVKLAAALGLWAGSTDAAGFLLVTALAGGALSVLILATRNLPFAPYLSGPLKAGPQTDGQEMPRESVPYGVALAAGGLWIAYGLIAV